jgi:dUTP pyrophosphatase
MPIEFKVKKMHPDAIIPSYAKEGDACMDLSSYEDYTLKPGERRALATGLQVEPPQGYEFQVRPRSGLAAKYGITVLNTPGTVDAGYRGEVKVILINLGQEAYSIKKGDRIAQGKVSRVEEVVIRECEELSETARGSGGFGSTGA